MQYIHIQRCLKIATLCVIVCSGKTGIMGFSLNGAELSLDSLNSANSENLTSLCLSHSRQWVLVQHSFLQHNIIFVTEFAEFSENIWGKLNCCGYE